MMFRIRQSFKNAWKLFIKNIFYSNFSDEFNAFEKTLHDENDSKLIKTLSFVTQYVETTRNLKQQFQNVQTTHEIEFETTIQKTNFRIDEITIFFRNKKKIIVFKNEKIVELKKTLIKQSHRTIKSDEDSSAHNRKKTSKSSDRSIKTIKTIVFSNFDEFIEKNKFRIDDWALKIQNKLKKNAHLFSIENVKIKYVQNFIDDQVLRRLEPKFRKKTKKFYRTVNEIVENLRCMYENFNRHFIAVNFFRDFRMKENVFIDFWIEFQKLFENFEYNDDHLFKKFIHKLFFAFQKHFSMKCDKTIDFYDLTSMMKKTTERWRIVEIIEKKSVRYKNAMIKTHSSDAFFFENSKFRIIERNSIFAVSTSITAKQFRLIIFEFVQIVRTSNLDFVKKKRMIKSRCFNCHEIKHIAKNCIVSKLIKMNEIKKMNDKKIRKKNEFYQNRDKKNYNFINCFFCWFAIIR